MRRQENEAAAQAAETPVEPATSGDCGATENDHVKWSFDSRTGVLTISGKGAMGDYTFTNNSGEMHTTAPWKAYDSDIKSVIIEPGVTKIGSHAFFMCNNLESVSIPEGVTTIEDRAFWQTSLKNITIPASVTQIGSTIKEVFYQCYDLESITVANGNEDYQSIDGVLYTKDGKTLVQYPQNKADSAYKVLDGATTIDVLAINYTQNLETLDLNDVTEIKTSGVYGNARLAEITLENEMKLGNQAFSGNTAMKSVVIEQAPTELGTSVFSGCTSLESVSLPNTMTELGKKMFANCPALTSIKFPSSLEKIGEGCFNNAIAKKDGLKGELVIPATVTSIGDVAFAWNDIQRLTIEGTPIFAANSAFAGCSNVLVAKVKNVSYLGQINQTIVPGEYLEGFWFTEGYESIANGGWSGGNVMSSGTDELKTFYRVYNKEVPVSANGGTNNGSKKTVYAYVAPALDDGKVLYLNNSNFSTKNNNIDSSNFTRDGYTFKEWTGDAAGEKPYEIGKHIYNYMPDAIYAAVEQGD